MHVIHDNIISTNYMRKPLVKTFIAVPTLLIIMFDI